MRCAGKNARALAVDQKEKRESDESRFTAIELREPDLSREKKKKMPLKKKSHR